MFVLARLKETNEVTKSKLVIFVTENLNFDCVIDLESGSYRIVGGIKSSCPYTVDSVWEVLKKDVEMFGVVNEV